MFEGKGPWEFLQMLGVSWLAALARLLEGKDVTEVKWGRIVAELVVAYAAAFAVSLIAEEQNISGARLRLLIFAAGYLGPKMLKSVVALSGKLHGVDVSGMMKEEHKKEEHKEQDRKKTEEE